MSNRESVLRNQINLDYGYGWIWRIDNALRVYPLVDELQDIMEAAKGEGRGLRPALVKYLKIRLEMATGKEREVIGVVLRGPRAVQAYLRRQREETP